MISSLETKYPCYLYENIYTNNVIEYISFSLFDVKRLLPSISFEVKGIVTTIGKLIREQGNLKVLFYRPFGVAF